MKCSLSLSLHLPSRIEKFLQIVCYCCWQTENDDDDFSGKVCVCSLNLLIAAISADASRARVHTQHSHFLYLSITTILTSQRICWLWILFHFTKFRLIPSQLKWRGTFFVHRHYFNGLLSYLNDLKCSVSVFVNAKLLAFVHRHCRRTDSDCKLTLNFFI